MKTIKYAPTIITVLAVCFVLTGCSPHVHLDFMGTSEVREVTLIKSKVKTKNKILVIDLNGPIGASGKPGLFNKDDDLLSAIYYRLKIASEDPRVKGVILRIDTPGGDGTTSDIIYNEVLRFKQKTGLPVVVLMMGVAASGGYYVSCASDWIIAHPTTITGSIGVISVFPSVKGAMDKIGINVNIIKSGEMKDAGSPMKNMKPAEKQILQDMVDSMFQRFLQVVHKARGKHLSMDEVKKLADGRIYPAPKALELKLVDEIGYFDNALEKTKSLVSIRHANVIAYTYYPGRKTNIYAVSTPNGEPFSVKIDLLRNLLPSLKPGFYYLWLPMTSN